MGVHPDVLREQLVAGYHDTFHCLTVFISAHESDLDEFITKLLSKPSDIDDPTKHPSVQKEELVNETPVSATKVSADSNNSTS